ncbi:hypothetical protein GGS23DRAFT_329115 [Durotheca rogersii]|uniref:uncharacterized protein n=1 Tax=Durotheca rogersii TaxID=419775 RepID=UPI00221F81DE|nr:uncharacterized protein GGS23DRAFT_329115 [Durotheca rogersii]KAI5859298.1 hypothetical protein GGS23DRAFT_329115 [Durotheca rogersii]
MPSFFIPARDARHRIACFALYRALIRQGRLVPLPDDIASAYPSNPITWLIQRGFRRNSPDTSPRLVNPALKAGYRILALLRAAATPPPGSPASDAPTTVDESNPNYASVIRLLRARLAERQRSHAAIAKNPPYSKTPPRPPATRPPDYTPLLVNVTPEPTPENPRPRPVYATPSRPRPREELSGTGFRQVPRLDLAGDFPFLRLKKPQPASLSRVLTHNIRRRVARITTLQYMADELMPDAQLEDEWENRVAFLLSCQGNKPNHRDRYSPGYGDGGDTTDSYFSSMTAESREAANIRADFWVDATYSRTLHEHGILHLQNLLSEEREDQVARADAMRRLIEEERALAEQERAQGIAEKTRLYEDRKQALLEGQDPSHTKDDPPRWNA